MTAAFLKQGARIVLPFTIDYDSTDGRYRRALNEAEVGFAGLARSKILLAVIVRLSSP